MTKKIIYADALLEALANKKPRSIKNPPVAIGYGQAMCDIEELINELATTAPEPQKNIIKFLKQQVETEKKCPINDEFKRGWVTALMFIEQHIEVLTQEPTGGNND